MGAHHNEIGLGLARKGRDAFGWGAEPYRNVAA